MSELRSSAPTVVVIAPRDIRVHVPLRDAAVLRFDSSDEFEMWRKGSAARISAAVHAVLAELECDLASCSARTQEVIARLCEQVQIPSVKELFAIGASRRSCYRSWDADIRISPAEFLERVHLLHLRQAEA